MKYGNNVSKKKKKVSSGREKKDVKNKFVTIKKALAFSWKRLNESIVLDIIKACILVLILTYAIFLIKPAQAHISANITELDDRGTSLLADMVSFSSPDKVTLTFFCQEAIRIKFADYEIEGYPIPDPDFNYLVIYPDDSCCFTITGQMEAAWLRDVSSDNLHNLGAKRFVSYFVGPQKLQILEGHAEIETDDRKKIADLEGDNFNIIEITSQSNKSPRLIPVFATHGVAIEGCQSILVIGEDYDDLDEMDYEFYVDVGNNNGTLKANGIENFESAVTGELALSYTPTPQKYSLNRQELRLVNKPKSNNELKLESNDELELECSIVYEPDSNSYEIVCNIYGYITDGEVSKMSLFPSFETWFFSNAYLTPTTIVTIVLTAIALFLNP